MIFNGLALVRRIVAKERVIADMPELRIVVPVFRAKSVAKPKVILDSDKRSRASFTGWPASFRARLDYGVHKNIFQLDRRSLPGILPSSLSGCLAHPLHPSRIVTQELDASGNH